MALFLILGGLLLAAGIIVRDHQGSRQRDVLQDALRSQGRTLNTQGEHLRRVREDMVLLQTALRRRDLLGKGEIERMRADLFAAADGQKSEVPAQQIVVGGTDTVH